MVVIIYFPACYNAAMREKMAWFAIGTVLTIVVMLLVYQIPVVKYHLEWRIDAAASMVRGWIHPGETLPSPSGSIAETTVLEHLPTALPSPTTQVPLASPSPSPTPPPARVLLSAPEWEKQDWNNCGPATLAIGLRYHGWEGDQFAISDLLKPDRGDRNVNIDELVYFVRTQAGWMEADYRVNGTPEILKRFIAEGYPIIVEKGYTIVSDGPDAGWAGHYLLLTGYDDQAGIFFGQDSFIGPDQEIPYEVLDEGWQAFNRAYLYYYPRNDPPPLEAILGNDLDPDLNREAALSVAQEEVREAENNPYAWFNLGTNLLYFERYDEAAEAYDVALRLGLPWRFTRYQFGPYIAYFNVGRNEDVIQLADATLQRTSKAEESMLWRGWARYRSGDYFGAVEDFRDALEINPNYFDAQYALDFIGAE
jgi:hypothetical protein